MWVRVDDGVPQHPKFIIAGREASWFWVCGNCYCQKYLTDGFIAEHALISLSPGAPFKKLAVALVKAKLWDKVAGGYNVHDFLDYNDSRLEAIAKMESARDQRRRAGLASGRARRKTDDTVERAVQVPFNGETPAQFNEDVERDVNGQVERGMNAPLKPIPSHPIPSHPKELEHSVFTFGENGSSRTLEPDEAWEMFKAEYPQHRRSGGFSENQAFLQVCDQMGFNSLMTKLKAQKLSTDWQKGYAPAMPRYFREKLWLQEPESTPEDASNAIALKHLEELDRRKAEKRGY